MSADRFLDSNVLIYQLDARDLDKHRVADRLVGEAVANGSACISFQVVQECLNTVIRKAKVRLDGRQATAWLDAVLLPLLKVTPSSDLYRNALQGHERWQLSFYDALIVAAAQEAGCSTLLTEDLQHGQQFGHVQVINPFRADFSLA